MSLSCTPHRSPRPRAPLWRNSPPRGVGRWGGHSLAWACSPFPPCLHPGSLDAPTEMFSVPFCPSLIFLSFYLLVCLSVCLLLNSLRRHRSIKLYRCQVYNSVTHHIVLCVHPVRFPPSYVFPFPHPLHSFPSGLHQTVSVSRRSASCLTHHLSHQPPFPVGSRLQDHSGRISVP